MFARILELSIEGASERYASARQRVHLILEVIIAPNPALGAAPTRVIELDYGMTAGQLVVPTRHALAFYLLKRLGLSQPLSVEQTREQQIVLMNREDLSEHLPQLRVSAGRETTTGLYSPG